MISCLDDEDNDIDEELMKDITSFITEIDTYVGLALKEITFVDLVEASKMQNVFLDILNSSKKFKGKLDDISRN